ncbi:MAG: helix-turn-helix domain-containing protein [Candidatus Kapabacteria bacterium]|nr:helix-turn-helix domain-containing protein [Candidatus Kapabacteria bacterium]
MQKQRTSKHETPIEQRRRIIGANLKAARLNADKSLDDAATVSGLSVPFISLVESGKRGIRAFELRSMLQHYGYGLAYFMSKIHELTDTDVKTDAGTVVIYKADERVIIDGSSSGSEETYSLQLLYPLQSPNETAHFMLRLPAETVMNDAPISINARVSGYVAKGSVLIDFLNDEYTVRQGETFRYVGSQPHFLRNFSKAHAVVHFTVEQGAL